MKAIMISIQPQWVEKILNGEKTIEIRKTMPKCELSCKVYIYCTMPKKQEIRKPHSWKTIWIKSVIAEFTLNKVEKISCCAVPYKKANNLGYEHFVDDGVYLLKDDDGLVFERDDKYIDSMLKNKDFEKMQLKPKDVYDYLGGYGKFYAWHIENLKIYDKPKELSEFYSEKECPYKDWGDVDNIGCWESCCEMFSRGECRFGHLKLERPPRSWCYVEEL